jgi:hypothetical protein
MTSGMGDPKICKTLCAENKGTKVTVNNLTQREDFAL